MPKSWLNCYTWENEKDYFFRSFEEGKSKQEEEEEAKEGRCRREKPSRWLPFGPLGMIG